MKAQDYCIKLTQTLAMFCSFRVKCQPAHFGHLEFPLKPASMHMEAKQFQKPSELDFGISLPAISDRQWWDWRVYVAPPQAHCWTRCRQATGLPPIVVRVVLFSLRSYNLPCSNAARISALPLILAPFPSIATTCWELLYSVVWKCHYLHHLTNLQNSTQKW